MVIKTADVATLQHNLIRSHACGVGDPLPAPETRVLMALRANALARGHSGIRPQVVQFLVDCLNADVLPVIPCKDHWEPAAIWRPGPHGFIPHG